MIYPVIICSTISSILYRAGGLSVSEPYWIPTWMRQSWVRDWLCPFFCLLPLFLERPSWLFILAYGAMGGAFSTYWRFKGKANFWLSGFMVALAAAPLIFCGFIWWRLAIRAIVLAVAWGAWSLLIGNDHWEEHGRGFLVPITDVIL